MQLIKNSSFILLLTLLSIIHPGCNPDNLKLTKAAFNIQGGLCIAPCKVNFVNKSEHADSYLWDFGDGSTSELENPSKEYLKPGVYVVRLTAEGKKGSNTDAQIVEVLDARKNFVGVYDMEQTSDFANGQQSRDTYELSINYKAGEDEMIHLT